MKRGVFPVPISEPVDKRFWNLFRDEVSTIEAKKLKTELCFMLVILAASAVFYTVVIPAQIPVRASWIAGDAFTSQTFPYLLAAGLFLLSAAGALIDLVKLCRLKKTAPQAEQAGPARAGLTGQKLLQAAYPYGIVALVVAYGLLFKRLGFLLSTFLFITALLASLRCRKWQTYLICYAFEAVIFMLFRYILLVILP